MSVTAGQADSGSPPVDAELGLVDGLAQLSFTVEAVLGRVVVAHDLSLRQTRLLGILRERWLTITELAAYLQLDKSSVTGLVDRAEDRGLVVRRPSPVDGRSVLVGMTQTGQHLAELVAGHFEREVAELVADLSPIERRHLSAGATAIVAADARRRGIDVAGSAMAPGRGTAGA